MPTRPTHWLLAYFLAAAALSAVWFVLQLHAATLTGLNRTVYASAEDPAPQLLEDVAHDVDLDFVAAHADLPTRFRVVWRGFWFLPRAGPVELRARADDLVSVRIAGRRLLHWRLGEPGNQLERRTVMLPAGLHSFVVEYEQDGGAYGIMLHGDGLAPHRFFRSLPGSIDITIAWVAVWFGAAAAVMWLSPLVLLFPLAAAAMLFAYPRPGTPAHGALARSWFCRVLSAPGNVLRRLSRHVTGRHVGLRLRTSGRSMEAARIERFLLATLPLVFIAFFVSGAVDAVHRYLLRDGFAFGDWLINYQGGFVRRGLLGEVVYELYRATGVNPGVYVLLLQLALYSAFLVFSYLLLRRQNPVSYSFLIFAPFVFMYHDEVGFRKEQIFLTLMAFSVWLSQAMAGRRAQFMFIIVLALYPLAVLSHEMLLAFLPYLLAACALWKQRPSRRQDAWIVSLSFLSVVCFSAVLLYGRTAGVGAERILESLRTAGYPSGAATLFLNDSLSTAHQRVREVFVWGNYTNYTLTVALGLLAFLPIRERCRHLARHRLCLSAIGASVALSIPLFLFAHDWGRFIRIHAVALFLLSLGTPAERRERSSSRLRAMDANRVSLWGAAAWSVAFLAYISFWRISPYGDASVFMMEPYYIGSVRRSIEILLGMLG